MPSAIVTREISTDEAIGRVRASLGDAVSIAPGRSGGFVVRRNAFIGAGVRVTHSGGASHVVAQGVIPSTAARVAIFLPAIVLLVLSFVAWETDSLQQAWARILGGLVMIGGAGLMFANGFGIARRVTDVFTEP